MGFLVYSFLRAQPAQPPILRWKPLPMSFKLLVVSSGNYCSKVSFFSNNFILKMKVLNERGEQY